MEATGNQNADLNSQFRTIVATTPPVKLKFYPLPTPIAPFCGAPLPELREVM